MSPRSLAAALGGTYRNGWFNIPGPGHSAKDASLGFRFDKTAPHGIVVKSFAGDDTPKCLSYVLDLLAAVEAGTIEVASRAEYQTARVQERIASGLAIWKEGIAPQGTLVESYLQARGCELSAVTTDDLRFHPHCPFAGYRFPAMLALLRDVITGEATGVHRTALRDDGLAKREMPGGIPAKMMLGRGKGSAVMLQHGTPIMGVAEGVETALAAHLIFGVPVWAALSAAGAGKFPVINVKRLTIFTDHDDAGLTAGVECARRYKEAGIEVEVRYPPQNKTDWNDYLTMEMNHAYQDHHEKQDH
jgi:hypothetical protein